MVLRENCDGDSNLTYEKGWQVFIRTIIGQERLAKCWRRTWMPTASQDPVSSPRQISRWFQAWVMVERQATVILISGCFLRTCVCIPIFQGRTTGHHTGIDTTRFQAAARFAVIREPTVQLRPLAVPRLDLPPIPAAVPAQLQRPLRRPRLAHRQARSRLRQYTLIRRTLRLVQPPIESALSNRSPAG
jgi:hypothetical protein